MDRAACSDEIRDAFFPQEHAVLVLVPKDRGSLWRSEVLEAIDGICLEIEDAQTGWDISPRCITAVPLIEPRTGAPPRMVVLRDEFPLNTPAALDRARALATSLEFALGDTLDAAGTRVFVHLPLVSFEGLDVSSLTDLLLADHPSLDGAIDLPGTPSSDTFRALVGDGPTARGVVGLYDAGVDGGLKEPDHLAAIQRFQDKAEGLKLVAQSFSVVDDLKVTRQGLRGGKDEAFSLPASRTEAAQLLLALSMSPATALGPRIDGRERVGLLRVNLRQVSDEQATRIVRKLEAFLAQETLQGARAFLCTEPGPALSSP